MAFGTGNFDAIENYLDSQSIDHVQAARLERLRATILGNDEVEIPASGPDGFSIHIHLTASGATASFDGLQQDFSTFNEALNWAERAYLEDYRLRVDHIGSKPWRWTFQKITQHGGVVEIFTSGALLLFPWFRLRSTTFRQNIDPMKIN